MPPPAISQETSLQIKVCRVLCIFFVMYVHVKPGVDGYLGPIDGALKALNFVVVDLLGRASVPALSMISGFLTVSSLLKTGWVRLTRERAMTLILPLAFWNLAVIGLTLLGAFALGKESQLMDELSRQSLSDILLFQVMALTNTGQILALNFLRDIFVCALLSPVLLWGIRRFGWVFLLIIWIGGIQFGFAPVVYRSQILMFFALGILVGERGLKLEVPVWLAAAVACLFVSFEWARYFNPYKLDQEIFNLWHQTVRRVALSALFLSASLRLAQSSLVDWFVKVEPAIYLIFLAHEFFFRIFWGLWIRFFGGDLGYPYHLFFSASPVISMMLVLQLNRLIDRTPNWAQTVVRGKHRRLSRQPATPHAEPQTLG